MMKQKVKQMIIAFAAVVVLWVAVFLGARYGWRLAGFSACRTVRIESVSVVTDCVKIEGSWRGVFPESFVGYHAEIVNGALYVGYTEILCRDKGEAYSEIVERLRPNVLIEDDCKSIGGLKACCITDVKKETKRNIQSIIVPEFAGIDNVIID